MDFKELKTLAAAFGDSMKNHIGAGDTRVLGLSDALKSFDTMLGDFAGRGVPVPEICSRMVTRLQQRFDWDIKLDVPDPLRELFIDLAEEAVAKTSLPLRLKLRRAATPETEAAKSFLLDRAEHIDAATKAIAEELEWELRRPFGVELRYAGRPASQQP